MSVQQDKFLAIANKIREKTNTEDLIKPNDFVDKIDDVFEAGKTSEYDRFWDNLLNYGNATCTNYLFQSPRWTDEIYNPPYTIKCQTGGGSMTNMYIYTKITDTKVPIDMRGSHTNNSFGYGELVTIRKLIVDESTVFADNTFSYAQKLKNITFEGTIASNIDFQYSPLTKDSIINIFNALSSETSGLTLTLKRTAVNTAFGIDVTDKTTYPEGSEFYNLRHSKDNWTVSCR